MGRSLPTMALVMREYPHLLVMLTAPAVPDLLPLTASRTSKLCKHRDKPPVPG